MDELDDDFFEITNRLLDALKNFSASLRDQQSFLRADQQSEVEISPPLPPS